MLELIPRIEQATHQVALFLSHARSLGLSQGEAHLLVHLHTYGDQTVGQIHQEFGHRRSTLTSILDRLEERQAVTRAVSADDRRSFVVGLTPAGKRLGGKAHALLLGLERRIKQRVSRRDLAGFAAVIGATANIAGGAPAERRPKGR